MVFREYIRNRILKSEPDLNLMPQRKNPQEPKKAYWTPTQLNVL